MINGLYQRCLCVSSHILSKCIIWTCAHVSSTLIRLFIHVCVFPGLALTYILENSFKAESGSRPDVPKIGILITDGKSQDDVVSPAQRLRDTGIELFAIGVKNADENELRAIASTPEETHVYNAADFSVMSSIVEGLTRSVCERVSELSREMNMPSTVYNYLDTDTNTEP
ncbi:collagen alpha-1(XIV) chain-like [Carassius gibelio]|uniref:collagen alpha-1(XIV) chain-like n=1 Tax=Carassius gibelio TaxID=101364 RepID=UPI0022782284|nr:collagen alpha-1(XIV) chain-like [Carassius gibelio]